MAGYRCLLSPLQIQRISEKLVSMAVSILFTYFTSLWLISEKLVSMAVYHPLHKDLQQPPISEKLVSMAAYKNLKKNYLSDKHFRKTS